MPTYNPGDKFVQTSDFGPRSLGSGFHYGVDFAAPIGTAIPAASSGVVWYSGFQSSKNFGNVVVIKSIGENNQSYFTLYAHMNGQAMPAVGQQIGQGDTIGQLGNTGRGTGPHLHFEVINGSAPIRNANGGSLGVQTKNYATDPAEFNNWADDNQPHGANNQIGLGAGGKGPITIFDANGEMIAGATLVYEGSDAVITVEYFDENGQPLADPKITMNFNDQLINAEQLGGIFGSQLGALLGDGNVFAEVGLGTLGSAIAGNIGEFIGNIGQSLLAENLILPPGETVLSVALDSTFNDIGADFTNALSAQTLSALSGVQYSQNWRI